MDETTLHQLPMLTCPACGRGQQVYDYQDNRGGDNFYCRHCEAEFEIVSVDVVHWWRIKPIAKCKCGADLKACAVNRKVLGVHLNHVDGE